MSGALIILTGGARTGKTTWGRAWVAEDPAHRVLVHSKEAAIRHYVDGEDVAFETNLGVTPFPPAAMQYVTQIYRFTQAGMEITDLRKRGI